MKFSFFLFALAAMVHTSAALKKTLNQQAVLERDSAMEKERVATNQGEPWENDGPPCTPEWDVDANGHVTIPDGVTSIGQNAFTNCSGLVSVTIPTSVTSIGKDAFKFCSGLKSVTIPDEVAVDGLLTIPDGVTSIGANAFGWCTQLKTVTIPNSVTSIAEGVFHGCEKLKTVTIPNSVTSIGRAAFRKCYALKSLTIPDSVTSIADGVFSRAGLKSVTIPDSVTSLGHKVFIKCTKLKSVTLGSGLTTIQEQTFLGCTKLKKTDFGSNSQVTHILAGAFQNTAITEIDFGDMVMHIGAKAFHGTGLTNVELNGDCYLGHKALPADASVTYGYNAMLGSVPTPPPTPATALIQMETANSLGTAENSGIVGGSDLGRFANMDCVDGTCEGVATGGTETDFLRDCRVLAEIAEKSGSLWECMQLAGNNPSNNKCKKTIDNEIQIRIDNPDSDFSQGDAYAIQNRDACFQCFATGGGGTECPSAMTNCKSTRKFFEYDSSGNQIKIYYNGPDKHYTGDDVMNGGGDYESDRLYDCFGLTGDGLDAEFNDGSPSALLEQRAERGTANSTAFTKSMASKG